MARARGFCWLRSNRQRSELVPRVAWTSCGPPSRPPRTAGSSGTSSGGLSTAYLTLFSGKARTRVSEAFSYFNQWLRSGGCARI